MHYMKGLGMTQRVCQDNARKDRNWPTLPCIHLLFKWVNLPYVRTCASAQCQVMGKRKSNDHKTSWKGFPKNQRVVWTFKFKQSLVHTYSKKNTYKIFFYPTASRKSHSWAASKTAHVIFFNLTGTQPTEDSKSKGDTSWELPDKQGWTHALACLIPSQTNFKLRKTSNYLKAFSFKK